ncbi:hypothetical protein V6C27_07385 [Peptococcaceae bacterium 1198_IL3148]
MGIEISSMILAAITINKDTVAGGVPIFYVNNEQELQDMAASMANILDGMAHQLTNGTLIIVKH